MSSLRATVGMQDNVDGIVQGLQKIKQIAAALHEAKFVVIEDPVVVLLHLVVVPLHVDVHGISPFAPTGRGHRSRFIGDWNVPHLRWLGCSPGNKRSQSSK